jgi:hypothetical protein
VLAAMIDGAHRVRCAPVSWNSDLQLADFVCRDAVRVYETVG